MQDHIDITQNNTDIISDISDYKLFSCICSPSMSSGNQIDGLPLVAVSGLLACRAETRVTVCRSLPSMQTQCFCTNVLESALGSMCVVLVVSLGGMRGCHAKMQHCCLPFVIGTLKYRPNSANVTQLP